jgi:phenylalanyl-tRNA synthetase alpha chain
MLLSIRHLQKRLYTPPVFLSTVAGLLPRDPFSNITSQIESKLGVNLHLQRDHPLGIVKRSIEQFCATWAKRHTNHPQFSFHDSLPPIVSTQQCFDDLLVPPDHVSRSKNDTYYVDATTVLRTHTSAHQTQLLARGETAFLCSGDVYRRDEIDATVSNTLSYSFI